MPPKAPIPSISSWICSQCTIRSFSSTTRQLAVGPEHPRYLEVPEPPQQQIPYHPPVKGVLPVPRDVFRGSRASDEAVELSTKPPTKPKVYAKGSREEWKAKMSEIRRQNLREGVSSLRVRQQKETRQMAARSAAKQADRERRLSAPEREDERLTAPSNNLDLDALFNKPIPDPTREARLERKRANVAARARGKQEERMDSLHTLYMNARDFIVTPEQLDKAVDEAFGTPENPVKFGVSFGHLDTGSEGKSVWTLGKPISVQDMLDRAKQTPSSKAIEGPSNTTAIKEERIRRIAETLTGGKMDEASR
ncbi:hypothetical protein AC578_8922 [Pseudocercospora eumusae]|uniref:Uncharacterized protein n=1 Tax=Pseudocercospora eumusae TaxID=321146 RepID=A0A139HN29_9PEZI|nr:hypothetical protein AC578_8922 [Pseudocercospora eumusae]